jgi:signal transduction histidine kinase/DNA-binding LacI/PurR family transcriptional regulator/AraC-like DNA-binding protein
MRDTLLSRPTIGVLMSMPVYNGTKIMPYQHNILKGIYASATAHNCNLLVACGMDAIPSPHADFPAWPMLTDDTTFVPVGPWNTDGLIVVGMYLNTNQEQFMSGLALEGHPLVFAGFEGPGISINIDNAGGIHQALEHLYTHGHKHIAFIAGFQPPVGESRPRLETYLELTRTMGLDTDPRLIAYGDLNLEGGRRAMRQIISSGVPFTAVLASSDLSCFGAAEALQECGLRIPDDVAMIGFDDILEARAHYPAVTTVYNPVYAVGQMAVQTLLDVIGGHSPAAVLIQLPVHLVIRQSCGCHPGVDGVDAALQQQPVVDSNAALARRMVEAILLEARFAPDEVEANCLALTNTIITSIQSADGTAFENSLLDILERAEILNVNVDIWLNALTILANGLNDLLPALPASTHLFAEILLDRAQQIVSERVQQQSARALIREENLADWLGRMSAQLLVTLDSSQIPAILAEHLPHLDILHLLGAVFAPDKDNPVAQFKLIFSYGLAGTTGRQRFNTFQFPPPDLYPLDLPFRLALLPLVSQEMGSGFVVFDAVNLGPCGAIVRNLASALRGSQLYADALIGRQQAEDANRLKSRFLSMVSHELRTPLNLIVGLSELLLRQQPATPALSTTTVGDLETIYSSAQHLGQLIGDVLDLASSEAGQLHLIREPLDLAEVLRVVVMTGKHMAREKGLAWEAQLPSTGPWVLGDRTRLRQVVLNLISNAVKFTSIGGVTLSVAIAPGETTVMVSDTGLGVPTAEQVCIFDEFQRGERTASRGYGGLGLGLAICKKLVELHGGTIGVRSVGEEGSGATFFFTLPTLAEELALPGLTSTPSLSVPPIIILTGHAQSASSVETYLADLGLTTRARWIDIETDWLPDLLKAPPAVILLETQLATQEGWQIIDALQNQSATRQIPVLVCTIDAQGEPSTVLDLNYRRKPLDLNQLAQVMIGHGLLADGKVDAKTILIVEDEPGILELHTRLVQQQSAQYRVVQAHNGREALAIMQQIRPDLVLLDLLMPELSGFGVLEAMRAQEMLRDVPVVVLTAKALSEFEMEQLNHGVAAILSKGLFSRDEIQSHIESALAHTNRLGNMTQRLVRKAIAYIHEHYGEQLSRAQIAQYVGITEDYLTDCFRQELGMPPITYLTRYRIRQARALLEVGAQSVTDVGLAVGFADSSHFSHRFQRWVGVSPNAYRHGKRMPE